MDIQEMTVTLYLDNDEELECQIICTFPVNGKEYIALFPQDGGDEAPVYLYRYALDENNEPLIDMIVDDDEFDAVSDAYEEWLDTQEYETLDLDALGLDALE